MARPIKADAMRACVPMEHATERKGSGTMVAYLECMEWGTERRYSTYDGLSGEGIAERSGV